MPPQHLQPFTHDHPPTDVIESPPEEFIRIYHHDQASAAAFHHLIQRKNSGHIDARQAQFLQETGSTDVAVATNDFNNPGEFKRGDLSMKDGYRSLGWHQRTLFGPGKFLFGKSCDLGGGKSVDVPLTAPRTVSAALVNSAHFGLSMHHGSGAWVIRASGPMIVLGKPLKAGKTRCLVRKSTPISINGLHLTIEFTIETDEDERRYVAFRNRALRAQNAPILGAMCIPSTSCSGIPFDTDMLLDVATFGGQGKPSGAYSFVYDGFDPTDGRSLSIKQQVIRSEITGIAAQVDRQALSILQGSKGIPQLLYLRTRRLRNLPPRGWGWPDEQYIIQENGMLLADWIDLNEHGREQRWLHIIHDLLTGLHAIDLQGWMFCDITPSNILYFDDEDPPRATFKDLGMLCTRPYCTDPDLAPFVYLPPEIEPGRNNEYTSKAAIFILAAVLVVKFYGIHENARDFQGWTEIVKRLMEIGHNPVTNLLMVMLLRDPKRRPSAGGQLKSPAFATISPGDRAESSRRARTQH